MIKKFVLYFLLFVVLSKQSLAKINHLEWVATTTKTTTATASTTFRVNYNEEANLKMKTTIHRSIRGQFHHHFTSSFYEHRSQKRKKTVKSSSFFRFLGPACLTAEFKLIDEIDPRSQFHQHIRHIFYCNSIYCNDALQLYRYCVSCFVSVPHCMSLFVSLLGSKRFQKSSSDSH